MDGLASARQIESSDDEHVINRGMFVGSDLFSVLFERTSSVAQDAAKAKKKQAELPSGYKLIAKYLTPEERGSERKDLVQNVIRAFKSLPKDEEFMAAAKAGEAKKGWYTQSAKALQDVFGVDSPRYAAVLAAFSPQVSVTENLRNSMRMWRLWITHNRTTDPEELDKLGIQCVGEDRWYKMPWRNNTITALTIPDEKLSELNLSGSKVNNFRKNLGGDLAAATNDAWMANFGGIDQGLFGSQAGYSAYTAKLRRVAEKLGWKTAEVQETVWSFFKALYEKQTVEHGFGTKALSHLKDSDVANVPDFATLMSDPDVKRELDRVGLQFRAEQTPDGLRPGESDGETPESRANQAGFGKHIAAVAQRAEQLRRARDVAEDAKFGCAAPHAQVTAARGNTVTVRFAAGADLGPVKHLETTGKLPQRTVTTQKFGTAARDMRYLMIPKDGKWLFIDEPKIMLSHDVGEGVHEYRIQGKTVKANPLDKSAMANAGI